MKCIELMDIFIWLEVNFLGLIMQRKQEPFNKKQPSIPLMAVITNPASISQSTIRLNRTMRGWGWNSFPHVQSNLQRHTQIHKPDFQQDANEISSGGERIKP
jgi:hypothetical protein